MGEVLESTEYCRGFCWGALQMAWHFKKCQDTLCCEGLFICAIYVALQLAVYRYPSCSSAWSFDAKCLKSMQMMRE